MLSLPLPWPNVKIVGSSDKNVLKYVFTSDTAVAEAVLYKYPTYEDRTVICCSTQSGCPIGCRFCGAGDNFVRSLTTEEIIAQPVRLLADTGVNPDEMGRLQIMFMSMGEPMLNAKHLAPALRELHRLFPKAALLISTSAPDVDYQWIRDLSVEIPTIGLQFSVHESTDVRRNALIPFKHKLTLDRIAAEGNAWFAATGRSPFFRQVYEECVNRAKNYLVDRLFPTLRPEDRVNVDWEWSLNDESWVLSVSAPNDMAPNRHSHCFGDFFGRHITYVPGLGSQQDYLVALAAAIKATVEVTNPKEAP